MKKNQTIFIIEPHPNGGIPIASHPVEDPNDLTFYLNDLLGTTLASLHGAELQISALSSFGQSKASHPKPPKTSSTAEISTINHKGS